VSGSRPARWSAELPLEPPPSRFAFPPEPPAAGEIVGVGADLEPGTILSAYRSGLFPMPVDDGMLAWWSPEPRGVLPLDGLRVSRSLRKSCARFEVRVDSAFPEVLAACAERSRVGHWITDDIAAAYVRLHRLGWAHSVEAWSLDDGRLAGGLYGIAVAGLFAGESMFHRPDIGRDASKAALVGLVALLRAAGPAGRLLDVQWQTPHHASLGVVEIPRHEYLGRLAVALSLPDPDWTPGVAVS
jgi:leucyl/phenylalanyl-tRNA--protein transferase